LNVLGIAYRPDGSVGSEVQRYGGIWSSRKDEWKEFTKTPYVYENQFDATPGTYKLTVVVSAGGRRIWKVRKTLAD